MNTMNSTNAEFLSRLNCLWHFMSAVDLKNVDELCRLCMSKEDGLIPIFYKSSTYLSYDLSKWIHECTSVKVSDGDGLPSRICQQCHKQLQHWAEFRQRCQQINTTLLGCQDEVKLQAMEVGVYPEDDDDDDENCISFNEERNQQNEDGINSSKSVELVDHPVEPVVMLECEETTNDNEKPLQDTVKKNGILTTTVVLGNKQNSRMKENNESAQHTGKESFICNECGEVFMTKDKLQEHEVIHSDENSFQCMLCGQIFLQKKYFDLHMRHHLEEKTHTCGFCGRQFASSSKLTVHMRVHTGERPYACSECGKAFSHKKSLSKHAFTHGKEKPFSCSVCKRGFSDKWHLKQHFRLHTGEKPYSCTVCDQRFTHKVSLREHLRHHTGEMWYCDFCPKKYSSKSSLTAHLRNVHRE